jgi:hypothetical protein
MTSRYAATGARACRLPPAATIELLRAARAFHDFRIER